MRDVVREYGLERAEEVITALETRLRDAEEALRDVYKASTLIHHIQHLAEKFSGCTEEYTYVYNSQRKAYHYWYIKCPGKKPSSIYLGKSGGGLQAVKNAGRASEEYTKALHTAMKAVEEMKRALEAVKTLVETLARIEKTESHKS
jgi:prefoldin subunit 5